MNDIAASIGLANLELAECAVAAHQANAAWYHRRLADMPGITLPPPDSESAWWLYTLLTIDRGRFIAHMEEAGIEASPVHARNDLHTAFSFSNGPPIRALRLPGVDRFAAHEVAIPVGWWLSAEERDRVAEAMAGAEMRV